MSKSSQHHSEPICVHPEICPAQAPMKFYLFIMKPKMLKYTL